MRIRSGFVMSTTDDARTELVAARRRLADLERALTAARSAAEAERRRADAEAASAKRAWRIAGWGSSRRPSS